VASLVVTLPLVQFQSILNKYIMGLLESVSIHPNCNVLAYLQTQVATLVQAQLPWVLVFQIQEFQVRIRLYRGQ
jgi:hypothetical protein